MEATWSPVEIHVASYESPNLRFPSDQPLARKRSSIWNHERRNAAIAVICRAILAGDLAALWLYNLFVGRQYTAASLPFLRPHWLAVVVEGLEHAEELHRLLPELPISRAFPPAPTGWQPWSIVTLAAIGQHDWFTPTVVINAVGGRFALDLSDDFAARPAENPAAIIELDDMFDEKAAKETTQRLMEYAYRRWPVFPERRLGFDPRKLPSRSKAAKPKSQQRAEQWKRATTLA